MHLNINSHDKRTNPVNNLVYVTVGNLSFKSTRGLCYKTLRMYNLQKIDRYCSMLESFQMSVNFNSLDKHTSLLQNMYIMRQ